MNSTPDPADAPEESAASPVESDGSVSDDGADPSPEASEAEVAVTVAEVDVAETVVTEVAVAEVAVVEVEAAAEPAEPTAPAPVIEPDPSLFEAHDLALAALREITPAVTIGDAADYRVEPDGVVSLRFHNLLPGYPGWFWTVSLARVDDSEPTVLEVELLPGDGALLAPDWVPWAVRLAEYQAAQAALAEAAIDDSEGDADDEDSVELDDVDDLDAADFDDDGSPILHAGDLDGVDIDELDEDAVDDDDESDDDEDDDSDDEDDDSDDEDDDDSDDDDDDDSDEDDEDSDDDDSDEDDDAEE